MLMDKDPDSEDADEGYKKVQNKRGKQKVKEEICTQIEPELEEVRPGRWCRCHLVKPEGVTTPVTPEAAR